MNYRIRTLLLFCLSAAVREGDAQQAQDPTAPLKDRLRAEILLQRTAWQQLEEEHPPFESPYDVQPNIKRRAHALCAGGTFFATREDAAAQRNYPRPTMLPSATAIRGACPWWIPPKVSGPLGRTHEYKGDVPTPAQLLPFSEALIAGLDSAARQSTEDIWPVSQLVRVLTENGQIVRARTALEACAVEQGWCTLLRIHIEQEANNYRVADSLTKELLRLSSVQSQRVMTDASSMVWLEDIRQYIDSRTDSTEVNYWWLAQPFFSDSANARRSEHVSRLVRNTLAQQLEIDVFYHTSPSKGGDARQLMRQKYGWPTHHAWEGKADDDYPRVWGAVTPPPPYSAPEYSWPRTATAPKLRAALDPLTVTDADFSLTPPDSVAYFQWWPPEFFRHKDGMILPLPAPQRVVLRRDTSMLVLIATSLQSAGRQSLLDSIGDAPVRGELWFSPQPDSAVRLNQVAARRGDKLVLQGEIHTPGIVSGEFRVNANGLAGGRTRFGVSDVRSLATLPAGACELSAPMLVDPDSVQINQPVRLEAALLGSLALRKPTRVGIVWESYGAVPGDSSVIAVHIVRVADMNRLQRAGMVLGVVRDANVSAGVRYAEPDSSRPGVAVNASVPLVQRHQVLDVAKLKPGDYLLQVEMQNARCGTIRSEQTFTLLR